MKWDEEEMDGVKRRGEERRGEGRRGRGKRGLESKKGRGRKRGSDGPIEDQFSTILLPDSSAVRVSEQKHV